MGSHFKNWLVFCRDGHLCTEKALHSQKKRAISGNGKLVDSLRARTAHIRLPKEKPD